MGLMSREANSIDEQAVIEKLEATNEHHDDFDVLMLMDSAISSRHKGHAVEGRLHQCMLAIRPTCRLVAQARRELACSGVRIAR
jgi:hypothetical protein